MRGARSKAPSARSRGGGLCGSGPSRAAAGRRRRLRELELGDGYPARPPTGAGALRDWAAALSPEWPRRRTGLARRGPRRPFAMAKWLNKYFSLGNSKTKSPPQPPRPDYREQRRRGERREQPPQAVPQACSASSASCGSAAACFSASSGSLPDDSGSTSDLIRAYRAQKERDFEDPYNGPGSSLRKLRAMCRLDYCGGGGDPGGGQRAFTASAGAAGCCCAAAGAGAAASSSSSSGSPHLYRSSSERRPATPAEVRYISPKHRLIKVESAGAAGDPPGGVCSGGRTWSPTTCGGKKLLNKCSAEDSGAGQKDKVRAIAVGVHGKLRQHHVSQPLQQLCSGILGSRL